MVYINAEIWMNIGGFLIGMFLGSLILLLAYKKAKKNLKDPWEEMDELDQEENSQ
ncbi:MAG: hypothetical protein HFI75_15175 [Lachnospiraceae bacterium]|nr:hypothetical protein [Lachnospiraceae bacterium]